MANVAAKMYPHLTPEPWSYSIGVQRLADSFNVTGLSGWPARYAYVLFKLSESRTRPSRIMFASDVQAEWRLGTTFFLHDGMTSLGEYMIVGVRSKTGEGAGQIPDRLIRACIRI